MNDEYVAGFFDGEGSVIMQKNYQTFAVITQSNLELLKEFQAKYGGFIQLNKWNKLGKKACYHWKLSKRQDTLRFLNAIKDYSKVKKTKIKLGIEMLNLLQDTGKRRQAPNGLFVKSDPIPKQRIYEQFKSL